MHHMDGSINTRRLRGRDAAREFCRLIAGDAPLIFEGYFPREIAKAKDDHGRRIVGTFEQCRAELEAWEAEGRSVYLHPNPGGTKKGSIIAIRALSIEFDAPGEGHAQHHSLPAAWHIEPSAIVRRGASLQAHWLLSDCAVASFTELQTRAQRFYQSDARAIGEWRLWRMPGFK
ncbi:MAG TPA: hypothetical protein VN766_12120, partial [Stellaceae bacterium]|nr:hypothetical protein [Stellaceae bacterium]